MKANCLLRTTAMVAALMFSQTSLAEDKAESGEWVPVRHLQFSEDDIEGGIMGPEGEQILAVPRTRHASLIELRGGFEVEIVKTMEDM